MTAATKTITPAGAYYALDGKRVTRDAYDAAVDAAIRRGQYTCAKTTRLPGPDGYAAYRHTAELGGRRESRATEPPHGIKALIREDEGKGK